MNTRKKIIPQQKTFEKCKKSETSSDIISILRYGIKSCCQKKQDNLRKITFKWLRQTIGNKRTMKAIKNVLENVKHRNLNDNIHCLFIEAIQFIKNAEKANVKEWLKKTDE
jgi:hypothetical protein